MGERHTYHPNIWEAVRGSLARGINPVATEVTRRETATITQRSIAITARSLQDYRRIFRLTSADLSRQILDCPGGASPFTAQVVRRGGRAIAVDPLYVEPPERIEEIVWHDMDCLRRYAAEGAAQRDLARHGDATSLIDYFSVSAEYFLQDYSDNRSNYVPAALPRLPFRNDEFDLVLSSHLLFCSPTFFSLNDHAEYILELIRVARGEVRIAPLGDAMGVRYPDLAALSQLLIDQGIHVTTQQCGDAIAPNEAMLLRPANSAGPSWGRTAS